jgi:hypothetical protein
MGLASREKAGIILAKEEQSSKKRTKEKKYTAMDSIKMTHINI